MPEKATYEKLTAKVKELEAVNKKINNELTKTNEKLELLANNFKDVICLHHADGKYIYVSPSIKHLLGYEPAELIGTDPWRFVHPDDIEDLAKKAQRKMKDEEESLSTYRIRKKDGSYIWFESVNQIIKDESGKLVKFVTASRDISERKLAEAKLKESEMKYRLIIENSSDAIIIIENEKIIFANNAFSKMLDYSNDEILNLNKRAIFISESRQVNREKSSSDNQIKKFTRRYSSVITRKDGRKLDVEISEKKIKFNNQASLLMIIRDISKQKKIFTILEKESKQIKGLDDLIPICAGCSDIRDDSLKGNPWVKPADYISKRLPEVNFSHTMCPKCLKKWYPDYKIKDEKV